jgi:hypothetical protein
MTEFNPKFDISQYELTGTQSSYYTAAQSEALVKVTDRVNQQIDWLAQLLGWNGANYWNNLPNTLHEKRNFLVGSFGVYNKYIIPKVYAVQNWDELILIEADERVKLGQKVFLKDKIYTIKKISESGRHYALSFGPLPQSFYDDFAEEGQLRILAIESIPEPFTRPNVKTSGNASFTVKTNSTSLYLCPGYDKQGKLPYSFNIFFLGSTYSFDQNVYISFTGPDSFQRDIEPFYDEDLKLWRIKIPDSLSQTLPPTGYLVWEYSVKEFPKVAWTRFSLTSWKDPSDWLNQSAIDNFTGAWGNKGGFLPFNLCFDALELHGFTENNSILVPETTVSVNYDQLLNEVYLQQASTDVTVPEGLYSDVPWWNEANGSMSVRITGLDTECTGRVEIDYPHYPEQWEYYQTDKNYETVSEFNQEAKNLNVNSFITLLNIDGLKPITENYIIQGLQGELKGQGVIYAHKNENGIWVIDYIRLLDENAFNENALSLPFGIQVNIANAIGVKNALGKNYEIRNLEFTISTPVPASFIKYYRNEEWEIASGSILKFIANTRLYGNQMSPYEPERGELWWDYLNEDYVNRAGTVFAQDQWVEFTTGDFISAPPAPLNYNQLCVFCNGVLLKNDKLYQTDFYAFKYTEKPLEGKIEFTYSILSNSVGVQPPRVVISDNLTSEFRVDVTDKVFSGARYYCSPNVYNALTPLRLWKPQSLQVVNSLKEVNQRSYGNPLIADQNTGPNDSSWARYFVRMPPCYERNGPEWQKVNLICQNFAYMGSSVEAEPMNVPPEKQTPEIYEEVYLFRNNGKPYRYVYSEPYLYSNAVITEFLSSSQYENCVVLPTQDTAFDEFEEANLIEYDPLHSRSVDVENPVGRGFGEWEGVYIEVTPCEGLSGYLSTDLKQKKVSPIKPPTWDASIYKIPPMIGSVSEEYTVDANNFKIGYVYFMADVSAAEDAFFDVENPCSWREPLNAPQNSYLTPSALTG